jgi:hypothetical protein
VPAACSEVAEFVAARLAAKGLSPHRVAASLRGSARSELSYGARRIELFRFATPARAPAPPCTLLRSVVQVDPQLFVPYSHLIAGTCWSDRRYGQLRAALAERGLAFEAGAQPWERLLRALDPHDSGSVEVARVIGLLLAEERAPSTPTAAEQHPYPNLQSQLRGSACTCAGTAAEGPADAARIAVVSRLAAAMAATCTGSHRRLLRELRRADSKATGQCTHGALVECFSRAGQQPGGQQSPLAISVDDALALCARSPTRTTVAYQELLEELDAAAHAHSGTAAVTHTHRDNQTKPVAMPVVPVVPGLPAERGPVSGSTGSKGDVVVSDLTGSRVRRPSQANRALAFEGAAGRRDTVFGMH